MSQNYHFFILELAEASRDVGEGVQRRVNGKYIFISTSFVQFPYPQFPNFGFAGASFPIAHLKRFVMLHSTISHVRLLVH